MKRIAAVIFLAFCLAQLHSLDAAAPGKLGEKWIYEVEGTRPLSNPPATVDGDRVDETVSVKGEGAEQRWQLKSTWGKNDQTPSLATIDAQNRIVGVEVGAALTIAFSPPVPTIWAELGVGESTTFETKLSVMGFDLPLRYEVKRLEDETITVPAGKFAGCRRIQMVMHTMDPLGQPTKTRYDHWMDDGAGLIKEIAIGNYQSENSQRTVCSLKQHIAP